MKPLRWFLVCLALLTGLPVQAWHHHGSEASGGSSHEASCDDACPHWTGHKADDVVVPPLDCPVCQFRSIATPPVAVEPLPLALASPDTIVPEVVHLEPVSLPGIGSRAPPRSVA